MDDELKKRFDFIRSKDKDNRSMQKELEWLINARYETLREKSVTGLYLDGPQPADYEVKKGGK
jgi:hypothetical protein